ncbi:MAG: hypothetical protein K8S27_00495 [Candidatus Omnitrophica bacterium]|nr:hypothetical protein [Candidatus Omnitrophota bacterium]
MKKDFITTKSLALTLIFLLACGTARADIYMKQKHYQDGMKIQGQQQSAEEFISETWITGAGMRNDNPKNTIIMLQKEEKMIIIDHEKKKYVESPLNMGEMMGKEMEGEDAEAAAAFQGMMSKMMKMDVSIQPTNEKKKINRWNCLKYNMTVKNFAGTMNSEIWATEDIKIDKGLYAQFTSWTSKMMSGMQDSFKSMENEMKKIKGVQVMNTTTNKIMNQTITSTTKLLEYREAKAPANLFQIPEGYVKESGRSGQKPGRGLNQGAGSMGQPNPTEGSSETTTIPAKVPKFLKSLIKTFK